MQQLRVFKEDDAINIPNVLIWNLVSERKMIIALAVFSNLSSYNAPKSFLELRDHYDLSINKLRKVLDFLRDNFLVESNVDNKNWRLNDLIYVKDGSEYIEKFLKPSGRDDINNYDGLEFNAEKATRRKKILL